MYNDHINTDMSYEDFCELCRNYWRQTYGFLVIDKDSALIDERCRKGFNDFAIPRSVVDDTSTGYERMRRLKIVSE